MKAAEFAERLMGVTRQGRHWIADCPSCHQPTLTFRDHKHSLYVECVHAQSDLGPHEVMRVGCSPGEILGAVGLTELDILSDESRGDLLQRHGGDRRKAQRELDGLREEAELRARSPRRVRVRRMPPLEFSP